MNKFKVVLLLSILVLAGSCSTMRQSKKLRVGLVENTSLSSQLTIEQQRKYNYFFLEAVRLKTDNQYDSAFDLLKHCVSIDSCGSSALYELAQYYIYLRRLPEAQTYLERAVQYAPSNYWYSLALDGLYQQTNQKDKAVSLLESMSKRFPQRQEVMAELLALYSEQEKYDKMIVALNELEEKWGKNEQFSMTKFRIYLQQDDKKQALAEIENLAKEYPSDLRYQVIMADIYMQHEKQQQAYDIYKRVLEKEPDNASAHLSLASYYKEVGELELYKQQVDTLLLADYIPAEAKMAMMRQFIAHNEQEGADSTKVVAQFDKVVALDPDNEQIQMLYAQYLWTKNMKQRSEPLLKHILQIDPSNTAIRLMWLELALHKKNYNQVIDICRPGMETTPEVLEFYFYAAIAYVQINQDDEVLEICKAALQHITKDTDKKLISDFYSLMGDIYHEQGNKDEAYKAYDAALENNFENVAVLNNYAYYLSLEGKNLDKAEEMSFRTIKAEPNNATYLDTYAWILFEKGNYTQAKIYIDNAMKNGGEASKDVVEHCGDIYYRVGDVERALIYWKKALEMGSDSKILPAKIKAKKIIK